MLLATHRGGPVVGFTSLLPLSTGVQPQVVRDMGGSAGVVSCGCLVGDCVPSLLLPCIVDSVLEHDPVLVRYLLTQTLREIEEMRLEKEKDDSLVVATSFSSCWALPAHSVAPSSASVVAVTDISWQEARWIWYPIQAHSPDPDLSQFVVPVVTSSSGAVSVGSTPQTMVHSWSCRDVRLRGASDEHIAVFFQCGSKRARVTVRKSDRISLATSRYCLRMGFDESQVQFWHCGEALYCEYTFERACIADGATLYVYQAKDYGSGASTCHVLGLRFGTHVSSWAWVQSLVWGQWRGWYWPLVPPALATHTAGGPGRYTNTGHGYVCESD